MMACSRVRLLLLGASLLASGCSWLIPDGLSSDDDAGTRAPLIIARVEGDGSERPITSAPPELPEPRLADRRVRAALVVSGEGLDAVTRVSLASVDDEALAFSDLSFEPEGGTDVSIRVSLPSGVRAGLYTLTLVGAAQVAEAQVFLLQGEPGPPGPVGQAGAAAPAGLTRAVTLPEGDASCPRGGARLLAGSDADGDGFLDDDEVESSAAACHGDPGLECADGTCVLAADLEVVGDVLVAGPAGTSLPLAPQVTTPVTLVVGPGANAAFPDLPGALAALGSVRIAEGASVTLQLEAGTHGFDGPLIVRHPDGERVAIVGADATDPALTVLEFAATEPRHGVRVLGPGLLALNGVTIRNLGPPGGHGVNVEEGVARVGPSLVVEGFSVGVSALRGAAVNGDGSPEQHIVVRGHRIGFYAQGALLQIGFGEAALPDAAPGSIGAHANLSGQIYSHGLSATGHTYGVLASFDSLIHAPSAVIVGGGAGSIGYLSQYGSVVGATSSTLTSLQVGYQALHQSSVVANLHAPATGVTTLYCAVADSTVIEGSGAPRATCP